MYDWPQGEIIKFFLFFLQMQPRTLRGFSTDDGMNLQWRLMSDTVQALIPPLCVIQINCISWTFVFSVTLYL